MKHSTLLDRLPEQLDAERRRANDRAVKCLIEAEPTLVSVGSALERVPFFKPNLILTSGAPLDWADYTGGQRRAVLYGAVYEGLAADLNDADQAISGGKITVASTQNYGCIGSVAGIYTASMPVFVVRDETHGNSAYCNLYEGASRHRLNYGSYNPEVERG